MPLRQKLSLFERGITHEKAEELEQKQREAVGDTKRDQEPGEAVRKRERLAARKLEERENVSDQAEMRIADSKCGRKREIKALGAGRGSGQAGKAGSSQADKKET